MNYNEFIQRIQDYKKLLPALVSGIAALLFIMLVLIGLCFHLSKRHEVVLVPMNLTGTASIGTHTVSSRYLTSFALSVLSLRLNFTPDTVKHQYAYLMKFLSPEGYGELKGEFMSEIANIEKRKISSSFSVNDIQLKPEQLIVQVSGVLERSVGSVKLPNKQETFQLKFSNDNGVLAITKFEESATT